MATDYILFIHGVNVTENDPNNPIFADKLFGLIQTQVDSKVTVEKIPLYWGDVPNKQLDILKNDLEKSPLWNQLWFKDFRVNQILPFVGDAAVYISRLYGAKVVAQLKQQAMPKLRNFDPEADRIHLVTHSWGTVILFDILFAGRWETLPDDDPNKENVEDIRRQFFGLDPNPEGGIRLATIHTMGSPLALFSLISLISRPDNTSSYDIGPNLKKLLAQLSQQRIQVPWNNFIHPGDPIAWPLEGVLGEILQEQRSVIEIKDILASASSPGLGQSALNLVGNLLQGTFLSLVNGGSAHGSYWDNQQLAQKIARTILQTKNSIMLNELDEVVQEILHKYKPALTYIGVDFSREDVQEALQYAYNELEGVLQRVIEYWYWLQTQNRELEHPSAYLITALREGWTAKNWQDEYLDNPNFKSSCQLWWEKAAQIWGENLRNELVADVTETNNGYEYILFRSGKTLSLRIAQIWGWERVLDYGQGKIIQTEIDDF